jgi:hypothetical protein
LKGDCRHEDKGYRAQLIGHGSFRHDTQRNKFPDNDEAGQPPMDFAQLTCRAYDSGLAYSGYASIDVTNEELLCVIWTRMASYSTKGLAQLKKRTKARSINSL